MFNNKLDLEGVNKILKAIECFGFDKTPTNVIGFQCYFDIGVYIEEERKSIFWNNLHEILESEEVKNMIKRIMLRKFSSKTKEDIKVARENLDKAEKEIIMKGGSQ